MKGSKKKGDLPSDSYLVVYTWGLGRGSALGHGDVDREGICAIPRPVKSLSKVRVSSVAAGCSSCAAVTDTGKVFTWGRGVRIGHGVGAIVKKPKIVETLGSVFIVRVSLGDQIGACVTDRGIGYVWGKNTKGALGDPLEEKIRQLPDTKSPLRILRRECHIRRGEPSPSKRTCEIDDGEEDERIRSIRCGYRSTFVLSTRGRLFSCGSNMDGILGLGDTDDRRILCPLHFPDSAGPISRVSVGSLYAAAVDVGGRLYTWGYGGHGNLGLGSRRSHSTPQQVRFAGPATRIVRVSCTRGQPNLKTRSMSSTAAKAGSEGPHTMAVSECGKLWVFGTCHKGLCLNLRRKPLLSDKRDELVPYLVGSYDRDDPTEKSTTGYFRTSKIVSCISAHIHGACVDDAGSAFAFGCGSGGRCGVEKYLTGLSGGRSRLKCYMASPNRIGVCSTRGGGALPSPFEGCKVRQIDAHRYHMIALVAKTKRGVRLSATARKGDSRERVA